MDPITACQKVKKNRNIGGNCGQLPKVIHTFVQIPPPLWSCKQSQGISLSKVNSLQPKTVGRVIEVVVCLLHLNTWLCYCYSFFQLLLTLSAATSAATCPSSTHSASTTAAVRRSSAGCSTAPPTCSSKRLPALTKSSPSTTTKRPW